MPTTTRRFARIVQAAVTVALSTAAFAVPATAAPTSPAPPADHHGKAVFVQNDRVEGNQVIAYSREADGSLHKRAVYGTGGKGGVLGGSVVDHLASQGSLTYDSQHKLLYAVNAGSNTVTVFSVDGDRLQRRQVIESGGVFPVSVTAHGDRVFVLNAREGGSIQGFRLKEGKLHRVEAWHRALRLNTGATPEFTHTPGQVAFTPEGSQLVVTTKLGGNSIEIFHLNREGVLSHKPVVDSKPGAQPFGLTFDAQDRLVVADGVEDALLTFRIHKDGRTTLVDAAPTGQQATCWVSRTGNHFFASNAGSSTVTRFLQNREARLERLGNTPTGTGTVDSSITPDGRFLYVQTGGAGAVDAFRIHADGSLTKISTTKVPDGVGGEGIVAL
ncbi:putative hemagglutinin-related protein [Streptomyces sp. L-9-10]|uniref:lactonase family protein n=1 Tax=Streptomyces sp. L-9-10 TaxID=1478131 RepID=UPI00101D3064|nr:beta-propeller fold lactonase family protein [Streptomyces sp. L-9-10]RYJ20112.1 putative hemagglutinin-related protein [Streptomyces sp. L-9-10]